MLLLPRGAIVVKHFHRLFVLSLFSFLIYFQNGHTKRSCKVRKSQTPRVLSHDDTVFWDHVDLQKLHVDNNHHDIYDGDSDDDAADDDDEDNDEDDDDDDDDENNDDAADDLFCYENAGPSN